MSQRETNLLWLKDMLDQLLTRHEQLAWAQDAGTVRVIAESMLRDLESCRRICEGLHRRTDSLQHA